MEMIQNTGVLLMLAVIIHSAISVPVPEEYDALLNPCGGSLKATGLPPVPVTVDMTTIMASLETKTQETMHICSQLHNAIVTRIPNTVLPLLEAKSSLQGFPMTGPFFISGEKIEDALKRMAEETTRIAVFLEETAKTTTQGYVTELKSLSRNNTLIMCDIHVMLKALNQDVTSPVTREIMSPLPPNFSISDRDDRNYLIVRDATKVYQFIVNGVASYLTSNQI